jgi:hypothetical protein
LGNELSEEVSAMFNSYRDTGQLNEKQFVENVMIAVSKTLRNLGIAREAHVSYLNYKAGEYEEEQNYLNEVTSFSATSLDGLIPKLVGFLGGGSALTYSSLDGLRTELVTVYNNTINRIENITDPTLKQQAGNVVAFVNPLDLPPQDIIFLFIGGGLAVLAVVIGISKVWKNFHLKKKRKEMDDEYKRDWENEFRPSMAECLFDLYKDLRFTMNRFYPNYSEIDFITPDTDNSSTDDKRAREVIEEEIIQPAKIERHFYIAIKAPVRLETKEGEKAKTTPEQKTEEQKTEEQKTEEQKEKQKEQDERAAGTLPGEDE